MIVILIVATLSVILAGCDCREETLEITLTPNRTDFHVNETVAFTCPVPSNYSEHADITWYKNDELIRRTYFGEKESRMNVSGQNLVISKIVSWDYGLYECCWSKSKRDELDNCAEVRLRIYTPPRHTGGTAIVEKFLGAEVKFHCSYDGYPKPAVYWRRENDVPFFNGQRTYNGTEVVIPRMSEKDAGIYYCYGDNGVGEIPPPWRVKVDLPTN